MKSHRFWAFAIPVLAAAIVLGVGAAQPRFLSFENLGNVARQSAPLVIFTLAQMIPILTRGLDLSQGGVVVCTSVAFALMSQIVGTDTAAILALSVGLVAGLVNGAVVSGLGVSPFVATLGVGSVLQGVALMAAKGQPISAVPADFSRLAYASVGGLPAPVLVVVIVAVGVALMLGRTLLGRYLYAIGSNDRAAYLSGVPVRSGVLFAYAACGVLTSAGAVLLSSRISSGHPTSGSDTALSAVAAAVIGGVSLFGGRGHVIGAVAGAVFLGLLSNALNLLGVSSFLQLVAVGVAIIAAVVIDRLRLSAAQSAGPGAGRITLVLGGAVLVIAALLIWRANAPTQGLGHGQIRIGPAEVHAAEDAPPPLTHAKRRYKIGVLYPFLAAPFWANEAYGVMDQAQKDGVDVIWLSADGYDNIGKQNSQIEDLAARGVDALLVAATSASGTVPAVDRAAAKGIPVFAHVTSTASNRIVSTVVDDDEGIGRQQARFMGQALHGHGRVAMLNGPAAGEWSIRRVRGFKAVMAAQYPGIVIVAEKFGIPDRSDAQRLTEDLLTSTPDLDGIFTVADSLGLGAVDAARNAGRLDKLVITTTAFSKESLPALKSGALKVNVDENPVLMGRLALDNVVRGLNGQPVPKMLYVPSPAMTGADLGKVDARHWAPDNWRLQ
jgi:ribose transport system permease protein